MTFKPLIAALLALSAAAAPGASFDCTKAATTIEKDVCGLKGLSFLDDELGALYKRQIQTAGDRAAEARTAQREWVTKVRNACTDSSCLMDAYEVRVREMRKGLESRGVDTRDLDTSVSPAGLTAQGPVGAGAAAAKPISGTGTVSANVNTTAAPASLGDTLRAEGYRHLFDEGAEQHWWKREPDAGNVKVASNVVVQRGKRDEPLPLYFRCASREMGIPLDAKKTQWAPVGAGSKLERVLAFACDTPSAAKISQSGAMPTVTATTRPAAGGPEATGPRLSEEDAQGRFNQRLGRCAARWGAQGDYTRAEQILAETTDRTFTRATYVALLKRNMDKSSEASLRANWDDACQALGLDGRGEQVAKELADRNTAYEASNPALNLAASKTAASNLAAESRARDAAELAAFLANDPVNELLLAGQALQGQCTVYRSTVAASLREVAKMRQTIAMTPNLAREPRNPLEMTARGHALTILNALKANRCA
jgi:uncharacterized protein